MSVGIYIRPSGFDRFRRVLDRLSHLDTKDLLDNVGAVIESQVRRRITKQEGPPGGGKWKELDPDYEAWKRQRSRGGILRLYGDLVDSLTYVVSGDNLIVGSNLVYAASQNEKREFLGISGDNEDEIEKTIEDWIEGTLKGGRRGRRRDSRGRFI